MIDLNWLDVVLPLEQQCAEVITEYNEHYTPTEKELEDFFAE